MNRLNTLSDAVATHARLRPGKLAVRDSVRSLTFAEWDVRCDRLAAGLRGLGLHPGDRVALLAYNCLEWMEIYAALARAGLVAVPLNFRLTAPEIAYIAEHSEARAFIVQAALASVASRASGSKLRRSSTTQVAPRWTKVWLKYRELAWHMGITSKAVSSGVKPISSAVASAIRVLPSWLRTAPLGRPVVPEV